MCNISSIRSKSSVIRDSDFPVYTDTEQSDLIMSCVYMHQAFNQNKSF